MEDNEASIGGGAAGIVHAWNSAFTYNRAPNTAGLSGPGSATNSVFVGHAGRAADPTGPYLSHNLYFDNDQDVAQGLPSEGLVYADPMWASVVPGLCDANQYTPRHGSPLIDAGVADIQDPDGTRSDIGPHDPMAVLLPEPEDTGLPTDTVPSGNTTTTGDTATTRSTASTGDTGLAPSPQGHRTAPDGPGTGCGCQAAAGASGSWWLLALVLARVSASAARRPTPSSPPASRPRSSPATTRHRRRSPDPRSGRGSPS